MGPDHPLSVAVVAERPPDLLDPAGDGRLADETAAPDPVHQLLFRNHPITVRDEIGQHIERLGLQRHRNTAPPHLEQGRVELQIAAEREHHTSTMTRQPFCVTRLSGAGVTVLWAFRYAANVSWSVLLRTGSV